MTDSFMQAYADFKQEAAMQDDVTKVNAAIVEAIVKWGRGEGVNFDTLRDATTRAAMAATLELAAKAVDDALRDHTAKHGPSGGAWNISNVLSVTLPAIRAIGAKP
jgi:hypothetical protein